VQRRLDVVAAGLQLLAEHGLSGISIEALRKGSGASVGSLYHHFGNLDGVLGAMYQQALDHYRSGLVEALGRRRGAKGKVTTLVTHYLAWSEANPAWADFLLHGRQHQGVQKVESSIRRDTDRFARKVLEVFAPHIERNEVRCIPPEAYTAIVVGPAESIVRRWLAGRTKTLPTAMADCLSDAAWRALAPQDKPSTKKGSKA
jgi:AcrR family transcriptional regulator